MCYTSPSLSEWMFRIDQSQGIIEIWTLEILSPGVAAGHWVPSDVTAVWPDLAIQGGAHSAGAQLLLLRPVLKLVLFTGLLWLLSLSEYSCQISLEEKVMLTPNHWSRLERGRGWNSRNTNLAVDDVLAIKWPHHSILLMPQWGVRWVAQSHRVG